MEFSWKEISEKYPLALNELKKWWGNHGTDEPEISEDIIDSYWLVRGHYDEKEYFQEQHLFYFFDKQNIVISIRFIPKEGFNMDINYVDIGEIMGTSAKLYPSREKSEMAGFIKAFELLEERLKNLT